METHPFLTAQPLMLTGPGFAVMGPEHRAWLLACLCLIVALTVVYLRLPATDRKNVPTKAAAHFKSPATSESRAKRGTSSTAREISRPRRCLLLGMSLATLALLVWEDSLMAITGTFSIQWWPLHTCNMCEYISLAFTLAPRRSRVADLHAEVLFTLGLPGALMALLFPGWSYCDPLTLPVFCGFMEHSLIVAFVLATLLGGDLRPRMRNAWMGMAFVVAYFAVMYPFNQHFSTNFAFISAPAANSPLSAWAASWGNPGYLIPYAIAFVTACLAMHAVWELIVKAMASKQRERSATSPHE